MIERRLHWEQLGLSMDEIVQGLKIDEASKHEVAELVREIAAFVEPRFAFITSAMQVLNRFSPGRVILAQLKGSEALAWFVATAGESFEAYQQRLMQEGDMVKVYLANEIGSMIAEKTADCMEEALQEQLSPKGLGRTNRFSPGYCGWHVREQQELFTLFGGSTAGNMITGPCGVRLTESCLMVPIKSVSGVIGIGHNVKKHDYSCGLCGLETCYRRK